MKAKKARLIVSTFILLLASSSFPIIHADYDFAPSVLEDRLNRVADWIYAQYNPELKLVRDSPITAPNIYWLMTCNLFSSLAMRYYYPEIAQEIYSQLLRWGHWQLSNNMCSTVALGYNYLKPSQLDYYLKLLKWGFTWDNLHEAIVGQAIPFPIRVVREVFVYQGANYTIKTLMFDSETIHNDWEGYFDFPIYLALSELWEGNETGAIKLFNKASSMWDGVGIWDNATNASKLYATYKLALLLYASRIIGVPLADKEQIEERLWSMQQPDGGIAAEYFLNGTAATIESNTETAPLVIIAYKYTPDLVTERLIRLYVSLGVFGVLGISILIVLLYFLKLRPRARIIAESKL